MTAQKGKDLLLKVDMTGEGSFETAAGLRTTRITLNAETVDVTSTESENGWRELLSGAGVRTAQISGAGVFRDGASDARMRQIFFAAETPDYQIIIPSFGRIEGAFQISALEYAGTYNGEATFEISLASAGALDFVALD